jgi:hypothetical protein
MVREYQALVGVQAPRVFRLEVIVGSQGGFDSSKASLGRSLVESPSAVICRSMLIAWYNGEYNQKVIKKRPLAASPEFRSSDHIAAL